MAWLNGSYGMNESGPSIGSSLVILYIESWNAAEHSNESTTSLSSSVSFRRIMIMIKIMTRIMTRIATTIPSKYTWLYYGQVHLFHCLQIHLSNYFLNLLKNIM